MLSHKCLIGFWICLGFSKCQSFGYICILNIPKFWIYQNSDYARVLNIPLVLNMPDLHRIECSPLGSQGELKFKKWPEGCFFTLRGWGWGVWWGSHVLVGVGNFCTQNPIVDYPKDHLQRQLSKCLCLSVSIFINSKWVHFVLLYIQEVNIFDFCHYHSSNISLFHMSLRTNKMLV